MEFVEDVIHVWMVKNHLGDTNYKIPHLDCKDKSEKYHGVVHVTMNQWRMMEVSLDLSCLLVQVGFVDWVVVEVPVTAVEVAVVAGQIHVQKVPVFLWMVVCHKKLNVWFDIFRNWWSRSVLILLGTIWKNSLVKYGCGGFIDLSMILAPEAVSF